MFTPYEYLARPMITRYGSLDEFDYFSLCIDYHTPLLYFVHAVKNVAGSAVNDEHLARSTLFSGCANDVESISLRASRSKLVTGGKMLSNLVGVY
jgi:hypothetical protein